MSKTLGEQSYEQFADQYAAAVNTKPHNAYYERPNTLSLLPDVAGLRVFDAGCGPGDYALWLLEHGAAFVQAVDVTPRFADITREKVNKFSDKVDVRRADLAQPLDFAGDASFDIVLSPLVLDYIRDWQATFREFHRILKPSGVLVASFTHPFWETRYSENYFDVEPIEMHWGGFGEPKPLVKWYRRPLNEVLNPLASAGFRLDYILEPLPTEEFKQADPQDYEELMQRPGFLCIRAVK
jgi:SAM-dependent methyltransferase